MAKLTLDFLEEPTVSRGKVSVKVDYAPGGVSGRECVLQPPRQAVCLFLVRLKRDRRYNLKDMTCMVRRRRVPHRHSFTVLTKTGRTRRNGLSGRRTCSGRRPNLCSG